MSIRLEKSNRSKKELMTIKINRREKQNWQADNKYEKK